MSRKNVFFSKIRVVLPAFDSLRIILNPGLSGPGRLHDLFVTFEAMTPGEFKNQGAGLTISYGFSDSPFGLCLLAITGRGICHFSFLKENERSDALDALFKTWPGAMFVEAPESVRSMVSNLFRREPRGDAPHRFGRLPGLLPQTRLLT